ncbi:MAG TPA: hypothetical protein VFD44_00835 [Hanamia sp.]|jgi:hypothetical protein|nr:hypothetical protein [Hanamia sp.]
MADKERITRPTNGSNELGSETQEDRITGGLSAGSDTQLKLTALGGKKHKGSKEHNEKVSKDINREK